MYGSTYLPIYTQVYILLLSVCNSDIWKVFLSKSGSPYLHLPLSAAYPALIRRKRHNLAFHFSHETWDIYLGHSTLLQNS